MKRPASTAVWIGVFVGGEALALLVRVLFIYSLPHQYDSDNSVVYLMARHVAAGEWSWFYWGQNYGGTLLQAVGGLIFLLVPPDPQLFSIIGALFWLASGVVFRVIAVRMLGVGMGTVSAVVYLLPSYFILRESTLDPGFYGPGLLVGLLTILVALGGPVRAPLLRWALMGALAGVALWTSPAAFALGAPALVIQAWRDRRPLGWGIGVVASVLTSAPVWLGLLSPQLATGYAPARVESLVHSLVFFFTKTFPAAFPFGTHAPVGWAVAVLVLGAEAWIIVTAARRRDAWFAAAAASLAAVVPVVVLAAGNNVLSAGHARYAAFILPPVIIACGEIGRRIRLRWVSYTVAALVVAGTISQTGLVTHGFRVDDAQAYGPGVPALGRFLEAHDHDAVYASYWLAYRLAAQTQERVTAADLAPQRYAPYAKNAAAAPDTVVVVYANGSNDALYSGDAALPPHTRTVVSGFAVYVFRSRFDPLTLPNAYF